MADDEQQGEQELTPQQVRQVAEVVYQMLLKELRIENERRRPHTRPAAEIRRGR
jgi:hypothetical protein